MRHRPIGLVFKDYKYIAEMGINFGNVVEFNSKMMETIYYAAMVASKDIAKERYELIQKWKITDLDNFRILFQ